MAWSGIDEIRGVKACAASDRRTLSQSNSEQTPSIHRLYKPSVSTPDALKTLELTIQASMPAAAVVSGSSSAEFDGRITVYVILCGVIAATGGLMFGYDIGISGGVTAMDDFLEKFFPLVYRRKREAKEDNYCKYDNQGLQLFTSSLYLAALAASFAASKTCSRYGRKVTMQLASLFFLAGVAFNAAAENLVMLIFGRILLGFGVGFGNQAVPLFLSEIAPARIRGALNILFQLDVTIGILVANIVNYATANIHPWGWRLSLGLAGVPAVILCAGSLVITETPASLIERGKLDDGRATLRKIRGTENVDAEFDEIVRAGEASRRVKRPFRSLLKRPSRPQLVIAVAMQFFQQFTGINAIMFYAPVLFQTMGFKNNASLLSAVITGGVNVLSTLVSVAAVDRAGRRLLLLEACAQMFVTQTAIGGILLARLKSDNELGATVAVWVVVLVCCYVMSFAWSWGPLGWLIPSETFPLETRAAGFACAVSANMLFTFVIAQAFLSMMCGMKAGIFLFFAGWIVVMAAFVVFLLPETKGVPIDEMAERVWRQHWYWKRYMEEEVDCQG
ncbi:Sugar transport protein 8 [Apostasia shenzhenica]|uniref:Sugar transport protein 8 n=1 Tax=Apostasia shenzhenica TaxID=1088818 RepID=A0A2I0BB73_9ASPA|nr:Sugar transport protein 8 [Apostasia shenzhenica]